MKSLATLKQEKITGLATKKQGPAKYKNQSHIFDNLKGTQLEEPYYTTRATGKGQGAASRYKATIADAITYDNGRNLKW
jgi:hypothetical protein